MTIELYPDRVSRAFALGDGRFNPNYCRGRIADRYNGHQCSRAAVYFEPGWWEHWTNGSIQPGPREHRTITGMAGWCFIHAPSKVIARRAAKAEQERIASEGQSSERDRLSGVQEVERGLRDIAIKLALGRRIAIAYRGEAEALIARGREVGMDSLFNRVVNAE